MLRMKVFWIVELVARVAAGESGYDARCIAGPFGRWLDALSAKDALGNVGLDYEIVQSDIEVSL